VTNNHPYAAIIEAAEEKGYTLIVMASHGRRGAEAVLLGSETHKVLCIAGYTCACVSLAATSSSKFDSKGIAID
jgi:hypothetical protein